MTVTRLLGTAAAAAIGCAILVGGAAAQTIELKVSHFLPPNHTIQKFLTAWSSDLERELNGRLKLQIYPATQLGGGPNRQFDSVRNGVVDLAFSLHGATPGRYATTEIAQLPYAAPKSGNQSAITSRRLTELAPTYLAKEHGGLRIMWMAVTAPLLFHSKPAIRKVEDFKGMKVRYAGVQWKNIIDALGAVPLPVPPQESQDALSKGIVDAATFPWEGAASFDLGTVTKFGLEPGISSATFALVMNPAKYDSLPDDLRALIDRTTGPAAAEKFGRMWDEAEVEGRKSMQQKGVQVVTMADEETAKMKALFAPQIEAAIAEAEKQGRPARKFYEDYTK